MYQLLGRHSDKPHREEGLSPPSVLLLLEQTHGQVPRFVELLPFCTRLKQPQPLFVAPMLQLNSAQQGGETAPRANSHTRVCARTHTHTHTLPSLVPPCTETLKSQLVLTLHIMSIVSKEKRFMELKHPQE